jgi:hypothetical protein
MSSTRFPLQERAHFGVAFAVTVARIEVRLSSGGNIDACA